MSPNRKTYHRTGTTDLTALKADSLDLARSVLGLDFKRSGGSYKARCPIHNESTPSLDYNDQRQSFKCFGCGWSGDIIALYQKLMGGDFPTAVVSLGGGPSKGNRRKAPSNKLQRQGDGSAKESPTIAAPAGTVEPPRPAGCVTRYFYHDGEGRILGGTDRVEKEDAGKTYRQWRWDAAAEKWEWKGIVLPPPYRVGELLARPEATILVCEGEKAVEAAQSALPDYVCTTSLGGSGAATKTDWRALKGRDVVVWPDNDEPGKKYAGGVAERLSRLGVVARIVDVPESFPPGWDLADPLPEGVTRDDIERRLRDAKPSSAADAERAKTEPDPVWMKPSTVEAMAELAASSSDADERERGIDWTIRGFELMSPTARHSHARRIAKVLDVPVGFLRSSSDNDAGERHGRDERISEADILTRIALEQSDRFVCGDVVYADVKVEGHTETFAVASTPFRQWLRGQYWRDTRRAPRTDSVAQALAAVEAATRYCEGALVSHAVYRRSCYVDDRIIIDLGTPDWSVVVVTPDGWDVVTESPVRFVRNSATDALPIPTRGGSILDMRRWLNVADDDCFILTVGWMLYALRGEAPFPHLDLHGEQGTGKTNFARLVKALTDPGRPSVRTTPTNAHDFWVGASRQRVLVFDNISSITAWLSDALCQATSGGSHAARQLYTDDDEKSIDAAIAPILNGIEDYVWRPDLADRAVSVTLDYIPPEKKVPEKQLKDEFAAAASALFGSLLDGLVVGLRRSSEIELESLPRMADFAIFGAACETAYWSEGAFTEAYAANREATNANALESDVIVEPLIGWAAGADLPWSGSPQALLGELTATARASSSDFAAPDPTSEKTWPKTAKRLADKLRRLAPALRRLPDRPLNLTVDYDVTAKRTTVFVSLYNRPDDAAVTADAACDGRVPEPGSSAAVTAVRSRRVAKKDEVGTLATELRDRNPAPQPIRPGRVEV